PQNDVTLKMPAFEWVHVQLHQQKGMISLSPPTICNSATLVSQGYEAEVAEQSNELKTLQAKVMKLEATLEAEKTISESLKGTIDTLTGAMAGGGTGKSKQPRSRKTS
ncbi:hypothetical protein QR140_23725, partial [Salmonella enterica]|nr:hypothetical protein [Salmonella enterica]MDL3289023.1 hypothetical protein [Salmonella enterica]MDL3793887.1 hypothetical protein [Salmonella enterica]